MQWGVIVNPIQKSFKYRVPLRWLSDELPDKIFTPLSRINKIIGIPFSALQQLTTFLNSILQNKNSHLKESNTESYNKEQNEGTNFEKKSCCFDKKDFVENIRKPKKLLNRKNIVSNTNAVRT